jgi:hypothetical protein
VAFVDIATNVEPVIPDRILDLVTVEVNARLYGRIRANYV